MVVVAGRRSGVREAVRWQCRTCAGMAGSGRQGGRRAGKVCARYVHERYVQAAVRVRGVVRARSSARARAARAACACRRGITEPCVAEPNCRGAARRMVCR